MPILLIFFVGLVIQYAGMQGYVKRKLTPSAKEATLQKCRVYASNVILLSLIAGVFLIMNGASPKVWSLSFGLYFIAAGFHTSIVCIQENLKRYELV